MKVGLLSLGGVVATLLTAAMFLSAGWVHPPIIAKQNGYRGTGEDQISTAAQQRMLQAANLLPEVIDRASPGGERATAIYKNVKVLNDLSGDQFNRVMVAITQWVSPDQGCAYCHNENNLADDGIYTKIVARRMLQMNCHINKDWKEHVGSTGVTCYTCHRGRPVPSNIWFENPGAPHAGGFAATNYGFGHPTKINGSTSLPMDPMTPYLDSAEQIRVEGAKALPSGNGASIQNAERSFSLMIHMSESLGVNCTFCHNTRNFSGWSESSPQRVIAWHGLELVRDLNNVYLDPLKTVYPQTRLGPHGDSPKLDCATCHQGVSKPLNGASMAKDYPELGGAGAQ